ncbi:MAG: hypothetical protein E7585_07520 [Ruminococcaceae bacterium]|nr:hypothetical protein [Oscillospiraceae bacterium]
MNYQAKVSTRADVRALYEKVIQNPAIRQYRGYTESKSYGWDAVADDYIKKEGEVWFTNPSFDPAFVPEGISDGENAELLDEQLAEREAQICELEEALAALEEENEELEKRIVEAEGIAKAAERERDDAKGALIELRRALLLVSELAGTKG